MNAPNEPRTALRRAHSAGALVLALSWLAACAFLSPAPAPEPAATAQEQRAYDDARAALEIDRASGERQLEAFLSTYPASPLADDAAAALGDSAVARDDREAALRWYAQVLNRYGGSDRADGVRVKVAQLELARGNREVAAREISRAKLSRLSDAERRAAYRVLADVTDDPVDRVRWLAGLRALVPDEDARALVDVDLDELLPTMSAKDLRSAAGQIEPEVPAARIYIAAAVASIEEGDLARAEDSLDRAAALPLTPAYAGRLRTARERLRLRAEGPRTLDDLPTFDDLRDRTGPSTVGAVGTLGVVLPLTGKFAAFGEESLQGVLLAAGVFDGLEVGQRAPLRVLVRDSEGRPGRAAEAVRELASNEEVVAIVGPLLSGECEAAAAQAEAAGIPLLTLTARGEIARDRPYIFRLRTEPSEETELLVEYAMGELGARRFAILYPRDAYGLGQRRLFWDAVERRGGEVVGIAAYDPDATDFGKPIRSLVGYTLLSQAEKDTIRERTLMLERARRHPPEKAQEIRQEALALTGPDERPLPPIVDFDAIFIPESHDKVVLIAPQLAFHEAIGVQLLGPNGWYHEDLIPIARDHVEGALFTAHFYPESSLPFVRDFSSRYRGTYRVVPDVLAAQAYDAANLVLVQLARGRRSREAVRDGVLAVEGYPGVSGVITMRPDGNASKRPFLLGVEKGKIVQRN